MTLSDDDVVGRRDVSVSVDGVDPRFVEVPILFRDLDKHIQDRLRAAGVL